MKLFLTKENILEELQKFCPRLYVGEWECEKSFYGTCIVTNEGYDEICIFCGDPQERK